MLAVIFLQYNGICLANQEMQISPEKANAIKFDGILRSIVSRRVAKNAKVLVPGLLNVLRDLFT